MTYRDEKGYKLSIVDSNEQAIQVMEERFKNEKF